MVTERLTADGTMSLWDAASGEWLPCQCKACCSTRDENAKRPSLAYKVPAKVDISAEDLMKPGQIIRVAGPGALTPAPMPALTPADVQHAATEGRNTERDRMLARLMSMEPSREPYSKPQSEWGRREARRLWERMRDAIVDGKEAHRDPDAIGGKE